MTRGPRNLGWPFAAFAIPRHVGRSTSRAFSQGFFKAFEGLGEVEVGVKARQGGPAGQHFVTKAQQRGRALAAKESIDSMEATWPRLRL